jgi:primosomal protein DnaI
MQNVKKQLKNMYQEAKETSNDILKKVLEDPETNDVDPEKWFDVMTAANYLDMRGKEKEGYIAKLLKKKTGWSITYIPTKNQVRFEKRASAFKTLGIDGRDFKASLINFYTTTDKRKRAFAYAKSTIKDLIECKKPRGLYLHSKGFQIGKTYLANAIVNELADKGKTGVILFAPAFARQAKDFDNNEGRIRELQNADIVVIDDIGAEYRSPWFRDEILVPVLNTRLANNSLTIFTSNYSIIELKEHYAETCKTKGDIKDIERLASRIYELADEVELDE